MTQTARADATDHAELDREQTRLIAAWRHEFLHAAMMTAFVTMRCADVARQVDLAGLDAIDAHLPQQPAIDRAIRQGLLQVSSRFSPAFFAGRAAYKTLEVALAEFSVAHAGARYELTGIDPVATLANLRSYWQEASLSFAQALTVFDHNGLLHMNPEHDHTLNSQCPRRLMQLLRAAGKGETLAINGADNVAGQLPVWVQRRRWLRRNCNLKCSVATKGSSFAAVIRNVSLGGTLLDGVPDLTRGTAVLILIGDNRKLPASVIWSQDRTAGIKFDSELAYDDPLIRVDGE